MSKFVDYDWPGNIKELKTCIERAVLYNPKTHIITDLDLENSAIPLLSGSKNSEKVWRTPLGKRSKYFSKRPFAIIEKEMIEQEIKRNGGNKSKAAKAMGISREALRKKLINSESVITDLNNAQDLKLKKVA